MSVFSESSDGNNVDMSHIWVSPTATPVRTCPGYVREFVNELGIKVDIDDEMDVRRVVYQTKRDNILTDLVRLQDLYKMMSNDFPPDSLSAIEATFKQASAGLNDADSKNVPHLTALKKRTDVLNRAVTEGLLDEHRDKELFSHLIRAHAQSLAAPAPV